MATSCLTCSKTFQTKNAIVDHCLTKGHQSNIIPCITCGQLYQRGVAMENHCRAKRHARVQPSCDICRRQFTSLTDLQAHVNSSHHSIDLAIVEAAYLGDAQSTLSSAGHAQTQPTQSKQLKCGICGKAFKRDDALKNHVNSKAKDHLIWKCPESICTAAFFTQKALNKHTNKKHQSRGSQAGQPQALATPGATPNSQLGEPQPGAFKCIICPSSSFDLPSAVAHHLESGCHESLTRHQVTAAVKALEIVPQITVAAITGPVPPPAPITQFTATLSSWDGSAFKCFLCPKTFASLSSLDGHLNSPAHDAKEFKCPKCRKKFILISALVQHLESLSCGLTDSSQIVNFYEGLTAQFSAKLLTAT